MNLLYFIYLLVMVAGMMAFPVAINVAQASAKSSKTNTVADFIAKGLAQGKKTNNLINEKSPYLLQHAFNPVNWFSWSKEAFDKARKEDKVIFLSIGYSTCHWCHVMAHESFENEAIADYLNKYFICIKVDREERPDLDSIYMAATQALSGGGGWPMSVFLTPDLKPFYAGTYFPPEPRHGLPGFPDLLRSVQKAWQSERQNILRSAENITNHIKNASMQNPINIEEKTLAKGFKLIALEYDSKFGGFGKAPKFPRPVIFNFLLRYYKKYNEQKALEITAHTLRKMAEGGMYDQIGGGFHRYSVDGQWRVPHFEKMLYDQSQLAISFLETYQITNDAYYAKIAGETLDYVLRDMTNPEGGFYSAEDADSPLPEDPAKHSEGAFYLWTAKEIEKALGNINMSVFAYYFGVEANGNALADPQGEFTEKNILYINRSIKEAAKKSDTTPQEVAKIIAESRNKLFHIRSLRPRPHLDDKVITSWNGLMISALAKGYQVLGDKRYLHAAEKSANFLITALYDKKNKTLFRRYRNGSAGLPALLDDYAFLAQGLLDLYEASFDIRWLQATEELTTQQIALFMDKDKGGFFNTSGQDTSVILRMKPDYDGAEPTGNSIAALNLLRLAQITNKNEFRELALKTIEAFGDKLTKYPPIMPQMLVAVDYQLSKPQQIIVAGKPDAKDTLKLIYEINKRFLPNKIFLLADNSIGQKYLSEKLPFIADMKAINGQATAYICENYTCKLPSSNVDSIVKQLNQ